MQGRTDDSVTASALKRASGSSWTSGAARQGVYADVRYEGAIEFADLADFDMSNIICDSLPGVESGSIPLLYGNFSHFLIGDRDHRSVKRLNELYARYGQVGYTVSQRVDAVLLDNRAIGGVRIGQYPSLPPCFQIARGLGGRRPYWRNADEKSV